eukprot:scaffold35237_cov32-Prasinocladus_malaysianus.AAC.1
MNHFSKQTTPLTPLAQCYTWPCNVLWLMLRSVLAPRHGPDTMLRLSLQRLTIRGVSMKVETKKVVETQLFKMAKC